MCVCNLWRDLCFGFHLYWIYSLLDIFFVFHFSWPWHFLNLWMLTLVVLKLLPNGKIVCHNHLAVCCITCISNLVHIQYGILVGRVFGNGLGDRGSIPGWVIPKTQKMILDATVLNTQHHKVGIKGKVEQFRERSIALPYTLV